MADDYPQLPVYEGQSTRPVETRIADGAEARGLVCRLIYEDTVRAKNRAMVKGMIDGNPPYNDAKRRANKLEWTANINFMQGQAMMDSTAVPYYAIFNGVENYADCRTAYDTENPDHEYWCQRISLRFHQLLRSWDRFDWHVQQISYWMRLHGIGPVFFDNDNDWRFRSMDTGNLLSPQGAPSCIDKRTPFFVVRVAYRVHELYEKIKDEESARSAGWDVECVQNAIKYAAKGMAPNSQWWSSPWELWQKRLKNGDLFASYTTSDFIYCSHLFVQELSGKVSHFLVTEGGTPADNSGMGAAKTDDKGFLLERRNHYDSYTDVVQAFFVNAGDGEWHSVRGYGTAAFKYFELSNRLLCRAADGVFLKGSLILQPGTTKSADKLQLTQNGPVTWIPAGAQLQQLQMHGATDELLTLHRVLNAQLSSGMGVNIGQPLSRTDGRGEVPTAEQIRAQVTNDASVSQGQMTLFYLNLDCLYDQVFTRAAAAGITDEYAQKFQADCMADGVPREALDDMEYIRANRASGYGSPQMRLQTDQQMMPFIGMLPEEGRQAFLEDAVAGIKGAEKVRRYVPKQRVPGTDEWMASVENDQMEDGTMPVLASGQDDVIHLTSHMDAAGKKLGPAQQAVDADQPVEPDELKELYGYVQILVPHCEEHLARLSRDPTRKQLVSMFQQQLAQLVSFSGKLRGAYIRAIKKQQLEAAQAQQATTLNALDQAKLDSMKTDTQLKAAKTASQIQIAEAKAAANMKLKGIEAAHGMAMNREKAQSEKNTKE